jgi:periplasmic copper chaperone A
MHRRSLPIVLAFALLAGLSACGGGGASISTSEAWARPGPAGGETAAYLVITSTSDAADTLVSVSSPVAASVDLHETSTDASGMTGMDPMDGMEIPAGGTVTLEPGGMHLMVTGLTDGLAVGDTLDLDLVFQNAGTVRVQAEVKQP